MMTSKETFNLAGYSVTLTRLSEEDGGGWLAEVPELTGCISDGETPQEALDNIQDAIAGWIEVAQARNQQIPEPQMYQQPAFSGKFTLRIPKSLHGILAKQAEQEDISLNQYLLSLISFNLGQKYSHLINSSENTIANHLSSNQSNYLAQSGK